MGAKAPLAYAHLFILLASFFPLFHCAQYAETAFLATKGSPRKTALPLKASSLSCDFFRGSWIYNDSYPLYDSAGCGFIDPEFDCLKYGRPDKLYLKYSWKPTNCELPRFDGKDLLTRWRGKKIMFVGDSISYNQWQSLLCMLTASVPSSNTVSFKKDPLSSIRFEMDFGGDFDQPRHTIKNVFRTKKSISRGRGSTEGAPTAPITAPSIHSTPPATHTTHPATHTTTLTIHTTPPAPTYTVPTYHSHAYPSPDPSQTTPFFPYASYPPPPPPPHTTYYYPPHPIP